MPRQTQTDVVWNPIKGLDNDKTLKPFFGKMQAAQESAKAARLELEGALAKELAKRKIVPEGKVPQFSFRYGVAVAWVDPVPAKGTAKGTAIEL